MAPVRRYLRITKYSVLECRIYLDNPALAASWLLHPRDPVLPRVMDAVRPLVLPKLREEQARARARKKTAKRRQIKDVVAGDGFEVSVFLTETPTRHALLAKQRRFRDKDAGDLARRGSAVQGRLIAETNAAPVDVEAFLGRRRQQQQQKQQQQQQQGTITIREESDDEDAVAALAEIPTRQDDGPPPARPAKRRRAFAPTGVPDDDEFASTSDDEPGGERADEHANESEDDDDDDNDDDGLFVDDHPEEPEASPPSKRRKKQEQSPPEGAEKAVGGSRGGHDHEGDDGDDKKKMAMDVSFEGFAIHGRVLCLVVKRRDTHRAPASSGRSAASAAPGAAAPAGQAIMENWISSTQMPNPGADVEAVDE
ncbi:hypothetical protein D7B24_003846 [Verticillium nonalfalfae]|uniref:Uncharacterized protein n=1 Tax=Verticillium nonalfalfae TaxID=1051616 RepID=A0A3M9XZ38_9PEZI|nr:uncharacterized protein D7B24_003846 [Verticillium nonalfalfae]RNJ52348.1 hypothetical protein D7B24_003846 [Verticillium nonalfalfae]